MTNVQLYLLAIGTSFGISFLATPLVRAAALKWGWVDAPSSAVKTHKVTTPSLGGVAIYSGFAITLLILRFTTQFPTGTLSRLRAILIGATLVFLLGIIDDLKKPHGLHFKPKFGVQSLAALVLLLFEIRIHFIAPDYLAMAVTLFWVVGITNALNIIDIMDGLSASQAAIASLGFLMISMPSEELYVNFAAAALAGAAAGFIPWNMSSKRKIFMGDSGSLVLGFTLASLALGTRFSDVNNLGPFAPLFILLVPIYDTLFVMFLRMRQGQSPFLGSKDHFALRLEQMGYNRQEIVVMAAGAALFLSFCAFLSTQLSILWAGLIDAIVFAEIMILSNALAKVKMK
jgi:UDP-GlcNAc:undecaprenyl-phosphate/decaprenyl-phosphate GlcNAc-1-phosphate transferase